MKRAKRTFTQGEKDLVFNLWKQGTGFSDIGKVLEAAPQCCLTNIDGLTCLRVTVVLVKN